MCDLMVRETNNESEPSVIIPKLPKCLCTSLGPMLPKPSISAPHSFKIVFANAKKKILKKSF